MSDAIPDAVFPHLNSPQPAPTPGSMQLDPVSVLDALGSDIRLPIMKTLADGRSMTISQIAATFGRDIDAIGKHLTVLRDAGLLEARRGADRRQTVYQIPAAFCQTPGLLDFDFCRVDVRKV